MTLLFAFSAVISTYFMLILDAKHPVNWRRCCSFQVILDEAIVKLNPDFFWLGGGEIDLKLGMRTSEFIEFVKPFVVSCSSTN